MATSKKELSSRVAQMKFMQRLHNQDLAQQQDDLAKTHEQQLQWRTTIPLALRNIPARIVEFSSSFLDFDNVQPSIGRQSFQSFNSVVENLVAHQLGARAEAAELKSSISDKEMAQRYKDIRRPVDTTRSQSTTRDSPPQSDQHRPSSTEKQKQSSLTQIEGKETATSDTRKGLGRSKATSAAFNRLLGSQTASQNNDNINANGQKEAETLSQGTDVQTNTYTTTNSAVNESNGSGEKRKQSKQPDSKKPSKKQKKLKKQKKEQNEEKEPFR